jgi:hypothetical protein
MSLNRFNKIYILSTQTTRFYKKNSPVNLEFDLVFLHIFLYFLKNLKQSTVNLTVFKFGSVRFRRFSEKPAGFCNPATGHSFLHLSSFVSLHPDPETHAIASAAATASSSPFSRVERRSIKDSALLFSSVLGEYPALAFLGWITSF